MAIKNGQYDVVAGRIGSNPVKTAYVGTGSVGPDPTYSTYIVATGGTITDNGNYRTHTFTSDGVFNVESIPLYVPNTRMEMFLVGGGGGGGNGDSVVIAYGGGGGAGGVVLVPSSSFTASLGQFAITVGDGGLGGNIFLPREASNGEDTTAIGLTAKGGGRGAAWSNQLSALYTASAGGSGAGSGDKQAFPSSYTTSSISNQSSQSGLSGTFGTGSAGGGQRGGGGAGEPGDTNAFGYGGDGITYKGVQYAGGGGGASAGNNVNLGGAGGGGNGSTVSSVPSSATAGTPNTGGGGGGGGTSRTIGADGGSGIVIITYKYKD